MLGLNLGHDLQCVLPNRVEIAKVKRDQRQPQSWDAQLQKDRRGLNPEEMLTQKNQQPYFDDLFL